MKNIFVDLDGVIFDLDGHYERVFGTKKIDTIPDDEFWNNIYSKPDFFRTMKPFEGAYYFFHNVNRYAKAYGYNVAFLTAASTTHFGAIALQKIGAVQEHISQEHLVIPVMGSKNKHHYMQSTRDILIDDWAPNCNRWAAHNGIAIHHKGDYSETLDQLCKAL